jgi:hypothetical protein
MSSQIYPYADNVRSPNDLGYTETGTIPVFVNDLTGIVNYLEFLGTGKGYKNQKSPSKTGQPLGNSFFLTTQGTCIDQESNEEKVRSVYLNFLTPGSNMGIDLSNARGFIPGMFLDLAQINPLAIVKGVFSPPKPACTAATLKVVGNDNSVTYQTQYITLDEAQSIDPCVWINGKNTVSDKTCTNGFTNMSNKNQLSYSKFYSYSNTNYGYEIYLLLKVIFYTFILYFIYRLLVKMRLIPELSEFDE